MTAVICTPLGHFPNAAPQSAKLFTLYGDVPGFGSAGKNLVRDTVKSGLAPTARAWDFLSIALGVLASDDGVTRSTSPDGWTRQIELTVAVSDPVFWETQAVPMRELLAFLTGDIWTIRFVAGGDGPPDPADDRAPRPEDCVCLLSGGMDSLAGAITLVANGRRPLVVSQIAKGDKLHQQEFAREIGGGLHAFQTNHLVKPLSTPKESRETSQRGRSIIFLAYGVLAATSLDRYRDGERVTLVIPENGFISINAPLTPLRLGSLSTRTTHPVYLQRLQQVLNAAGLRIDLDNPFATMTKGQVLKACPDQATLKRFVSKSTSCGRFARTGFRHCGRCVPCLVRRAAMFEWGQPDRPVKPYKYATLSQPDAHHLFFEDVRSVGMAIEAVNQFGVETWLGATLNSAELSNVSQYQAVCNSGIKELERFMRHEGAL